MKKVLKWIGIGLGVLVGLVLLAGAGLYVYSEQALNRKYNVQSEAIVIPTDEATIARGYHLVHNLVACTECHGPNLAGDIFDEGAMVANIGISNLTPGRGGIGDVYTDEDWVRAIRHGVGLDGKSLTIMPSQFFYHMSDADLGAVIAYLKTLPPVDKEIPTTTFGPVGRVFLVQLPELLSASVIDHGSPHDNEISPSISGEYGEYLASMLCISCHGEDLGGLTTEEGGPNITLGGELAEWSEEDFSRSLWTGLTPDGERIDDEMMPLSATIGYTDDEVKALWLYIQSMPAIASTPMPPAN